MRRITLTLLCFACGWSQAVADDSVTDVFPLRNHNPFLQIYGLPAFRTAGIVAPGSIDFDITFDVANDADKADRLDEVLVIDSESRVVSLTLRRRFGERFEVGIDVPYVEHSGGSLDNLIYEFHDAVGLPNSTREGPDDEFELFFARNGVTLFDRNRPTSGLGDVQISAAMALGKITLHGGIKLPTGDADKLTGSGAADFSLGVYRDGATALFGRELAISGFFGLLALGEGEVLPSLQRDVVPYGGLAAQWHATTRFSLVTQLYAQGAYFDANLDELGGNTFQLAFGTEYRLPKQGLLLRLAIAEDIAAAAAPDFALHLSIRRYSR